MMWIVRLALRRPYTFTVTSILIVMLGIVTIFRMSTDIFPSIDIPVVSVIWSYAGVAPEEMEKRFVTVTERAMTTTVNNIEHIESQSYNGVAVIKVYFHEGAKVELGVAQVTSIVQTLLRTMPPGTTPPLVVQFSASNVPILQLALSSKTLSEQELYDLGLNFVRTQLATVQGAQIPLPYGGKSRQVMVDIDPQKLFATGISPSDVSNALNAQNVILPAGTEKVGDREYNVRLNSSPELLQSLNDLPVKQVNGATIYMRDVATVRDGFAVQQNIVAQNRTRAALLTVLKSAEASTLDIIRRVKTALPGVEATLPKELQITELFDQSIFVRASINGVLKEGVIAACLTALMILLFLGSWRSTLVVATSIPLSILCSVIILSALGQTLNIMTLGGLALAVGILVDDATVEIENIHRNLAMKKPMVRAILDGAQQIATPAFVSTICICIVFVPVFFLSGTARFLFAPLAMAVIFAMLASYLLSRTVVPTMVKFLLKDHLDEVETEGVEGGGHDSERENGQRETSPAQSRHDRVRENREKWNRAVGALPRGEEPILLPEHTEDWAHDGSGKKEQPQQPPKRGRFARLRGWAEKGGGLFHGVHKRFNEFFIHLRDRYTGALDRALDHRALVFGIMIGMILFSFCLVPFLGQDFFPEVDSGQFRLHVRAPEGTRIEVTEQRFYQVGRAIRETIPAKEVQTVLDNIGLPISGINLAFSDNATVSSADGEILVSLDPEHHGSTREYMRTLREKLHAQFPDMGFYFAAPDIVSQILNAGLPAPIDVQITGRDPKNYDVAKQLQQRIAKIPGAVDVHLHQLVHGPDLRVDVDRTRAQQIGLTQRDVAGTMLVSLSSSGQNAPNFWLNFQNGVNYQVAVQTPQYKMDTLDQLRNTPVVVPGLPQPQLLGNLASIERRESPVIVNHYNVQPVFDVLANTQDRDLGGVAEDIQKAVQEFEPKPSILRKCANAVGFGGWLDKHGRMKVPESKLPRGSVIHVRGQVDSMNKSFVGIGFGILFAVVLVYFLMVVNFQSWTDPFIIIMALPGALCGIIWMLFITGTTINVPSLMGAIMAIGVATSNSILLITFANDERCAGDKDARAAALAAGHTRLRPVLMTALAMIIGMLPMSLGLGEGGEQNAPLGRAVIGGLIVATITTLFFVPVVYSVLRKKEFECDADEKFDREAENEEKEVEQHA
ncbi:MAG: efflux RND transporter permease subunit [Chthoniobacter sp.]|nr:efflux RND transporter permease subunit [Chthoniobacter sp.]